MSPLRIVRNIADPDNAETADTGAIPVGVSSNEAKLD